MQYWFQAKRLFYGYNNHCHIWGRPDLLVFKQLSLSSFMPSYYLWIWWKCDNAVTTMTTNKGDGFFGVLTFFHVWLHGTLDLSHFKDEQDRDGSTVIRGPGTINSFQLVLISAMERKRKKTTTSQGPPTINWITHEWKLIISASFICREY